MIAIMNVDVISFDKILDVFYVQQMALTGLILKLKFSS